MSTMCNLNTGKSCRIPDTDLPDDILRQSVAKLPNGEYCTQICRKCGVYHVERNGDYKNAKVVSQCRSCFIPE